MPQNSKTYLKSMGLFGYSETVRRLGGSADELYRQAGLPVDLLKHPDQFISFQKYCHLLELTAHELGRDFAIQWALDLRPNFPHLGPIAMLAK